MNTSFQQDLTNYKQEFERARNELYKAFRSNINVWSTEQERKFRATLRLADTILTDFLQYVNTPSEFFNLKFLVGTWLNLLIDTDTGITVLDHIGLNYNKTLVDR
jgi:hypothetical protein